MNEDHALTLRDADDLPNLSGYKSHLASLIKDDYEGYCSMIYAIEKGAYANVVAEAFGIAPSTFRNWYDLGVRDLISEKDSIYSRFSTDIRRALSRCRMQVESHIKDTDPKFWLSKGPGRWISDDWSDTKTSTVKHEGIVEHKGSISHQGELSHSGSLTHLHLEPVELASILQELANAGLLTLDESTQRLIDHTKSTPNISLSDLEDSLEEDILEAITED